MVEWVAQYDNHWRMMGINLYYVAVLGTVRLPGFELHDRAIAWCI